MRVTDEQLAILQTCPFLYDNVSIADDALLPSNQAPVAGEGT